jgi:membrane associated rhomboid family serine protease
VEILGRLRLSFWVVVAGVIVLYVFFVALAAVPPAKVAGVSIAVAGLAAMFTLRNLRIASELADRGGDPRMRRALNRMRERRGF